jgi:ABC-type xylose transport system permease subunit
MATKKPINRPKTRNPPEIKILLKLRSVVLGVFKVKKKHLNITPLIIWNLLTQKSTILVAKIFLNSHFLSLS